CSQCKHARSSPLRSETGLCATIVLHRHGYDRLMTQYLPISGALTTFIAALDLLPVEHTLPAVRICACAARPNRGGGGRPRGQGGARRKNGEGAWSISRLNFYGRSCSSSISAALPKRRSRSALPSRRSVRKSSGCNSCSVTSSSTRAPPA